MRLPFMQLESDLVAHGASTVARLAGCSVPQALGHIALLRAWAVSRATDEAPPDGMVLGDAAPRLIEAAAGWEGEKGGLLQALVDAGQVERTCDGVRVLHLNPYVTAWERNAKAKARMANARERSQNMRVTNGERSAKFGGQTQTQTQTEEDLPADAGEQGDLLADEQPAKPKGPPPEALRDLWNRLAPPRGLQRWEAMGEDRKRLARLSLAACPDLARWEAWLTHELARPFNLGETGWKADVDWLLRAKTRNLVLDFNPAVATATKTASGGDVPRLGPKPTPPAPPAGDRPRL